MSEKPKQITNKSDWYDARLVSEKSSPFGAVVFFLILAIAVLSVVAFGAVDVWALGLFALLTGAVWILWMADAWRVGELRFNTSLLQIPLAGLVLIGLIQLLPLGNSGVSTDLLSAAPVVNTISVAPYLTRFAVVQLVTYLIFFAAALAFINNQKRLRKAVLTVVIFGALIGFFGILQKLADVEGIYGARQTADAFTFGTYVNQHHFAALMEMTIGLTLALLFGKAFGRDKQIFLIVAAVIMGIAILFTGSSGGFVSLFALLFFVVAANLLRKSNSDESDSDEAEKPTVLRRRLTILVGGLAVVIGLFGAVILLGGDAFLLRSSGLARNADDISNGRVHFWQTALKIIADYPVLGSGLDSFGVSFTRYDTWNGSLRIEQAHNDYLQIMADAGILGLLCVVAFVVILFKQSFGIIAKSSDNFRRSVALGGLAGCFGIIVHSFFDFPLRTPANGYFFLVLAVLATAAINYPKLYKKRKSGIERGAALQQ